jgi:ribosomal protein S18 acetylase RimI-like enzyme
LSEGRGAPEALSSATMRRVDPTIDREAIQRAVRACFTAPAYTVHPGELDWWFFHPNPAWHDLSVTLGDEGVAVIAPGICEASLFGLLPNLLPWAEAVLPRRDLQVGWISIHDHAAERFLIDRGYRPNNRGMRVFQATVADLKQTVTVPDGFVVRAVAGWSEANARADAAHAAFRSALSREDHRVRYRRFMGSPGYVPSRDIVAVTEAGEVASFAIYWGDHDLGLAQLEPVGTREPFRRRGLAAAVIAHVILEMRKDGIQRVRVCADEDRVAAVELYRSLGFREIDRLRWWR